MRRALLVSAFVLSVLACATARAPGAPPALASPESAGFSSERLARLTARMQEFEQDERISGVVTLVWRKGPWSTLMRSASRTSRRRRRCDATRCSASPR